jgi:hypothetical protein
MDSGKQITQYLEELAKVLIDLHVPIPFHILIAGGAYMLLQKKRRSTEDIDFAIIEEPQTRTPPNKVVRIVVKKAEVFSKRSTVPYSTEFRQAVEIVARKYTNLPDDWCNDEAAVYYYDDAPHAEGTFWRSFGNIVYVYLPTMEYMLATKIAAYRPKDANDIQRLIQELKIHTREQAKAIVDKFLLSDAQEFWEVDEKLEVLFP